MSRLSEILGVPEGQEFKYDVEVFPNVIFKIEGSYRFYKENNGFWEKTSNELSLCEMIEHPEKIELIIKDPLIKKRINVIKGRVCEGWRWIAKDGDGKVYFYKNRPVYEETKKKFYTDDDYSETNNKLFEFIKCGECIYLSYLEEEENE